MISFVDFVEKEIGKSPEAIASYLSTEIADLAKNCRIDWDKTKNNIPYDGSRQYTPNVKGIEKDDCGRVYLWASVKKHEQKDGKTLYYPFITFKSYQSTYNEPSETFNSLQELFSLYMKYKESGELTRKIIKNIDGDVTDRKKIAEEQALTKIKQKKHIKKESILFQHLPSLGSKKTLFSPYTNAKKVTIAAKRIPEIKVGSDSNGYYTCFPLHDIKGTFLGLQKIYHVKPKKIDGNKKISWGMNPIGSMFIIGDLSTSETCYIVEGLATGLSMRMATGKTIIVCLIANNIESVSKEIALTYPNCKRVHVADNDNIKINHGNTGIYKCSLAVKKYGGFVFVPKPSKGTDANDVHVNDGLSKLKEQINNPDNYFNGRFSQHVNGIFNWVPQEATID